MQTNYQEMDEKKRELHRLIRFTLLTVIAAAVSSLALHVFEYPNAFVPLGLEAVVTMLQTVTGVNAGWINLALNAPLVVYAFFKLNKKYVAFTLLFTLLSSVFLIVFEAAGVPMYVAENEKLIAALFAGLMLGTRSGIMLRIGASTGGVDIIARIVQNRLQFVNIERIISVLCFVLILLSYFVYHDVNCILLGIVQMYINEKVVTFLMKDNREAVKVEIVTRDPERIRDDVVTTLRHSATILDGRGMYSGKEYFVVFTVLNLYQVAEFDRLMKKYPDAFVYYYNVKGVYGNFRRFRDEAVK